ncbi:MAG TPA: glycosyltransferase family 39 protein [Gemmatimonadales bacterium]|nr:glycosyltransferase family 39 protein [Gemmatimonadales bacterium]
MLPRTSRILPALLLGALIFRVAWWLLYVDVVENEGVEYIRLAANWFSGHGYVSIFGGPHTLFPPFYPLLIGLTSLLTGSTEFAARLVSLASGLLLVWAVYRLASDVLGEVAGIAAGALAAVHPLLVALSVSTYSEALYLGLSMAAAALAVRWVARPSVWLALSVGALCGVAYLTRPEGIALAPLFAVTLLLASRRLGLRKAVGSGAALGLTALLVALPYVGWLSAIAGTFRWEGKSAMNNLVVANLARGESYGEAARGLDSAGAPTGAFMFLDQHARLRESRPEGGSLLREIARDPLGRGYQVASRVLNARFLGGILILVLAATGFLFGGAWRREPVGAILALVPSMVTLAALLSVEWLWDRYLFALLPGLLIWAGGGIQRIARVSRSAALGVALLVPALSLRPVLGVGDINQTRLTDVRVTGTWIGTDARTRTPGERPLIAGSRLALAHYAEGEEVYLPWADEARALIFLRRIGPDYVAVRTSEREMAPYLRAWLDGEGPSECLTPAEGLPPEASRFYRVWRWRC